MKTVATLVCSAGARNTLGPKFPNFNVSPPEYHQFVGEPDKIKIDMFDDYD